MSHKRTLFLAQGAVIAALYVALTLIFAPISFGTTGIDVRIAEALTILPVFTPAAVPGVFIGCLLSNILGGGIIWDILFGSLATLIGAVGCRALKDRRVLAPIPAVLANTLIVPLILRFGYGLELPLVMLFLSVGIGELLSAYLLGQLLLSALLPFKKYLNQAAE